MTAANSYFDHIPSKWKADLALSMVRPEELAKKDDYIAYRHENLSLFYFANPEGKGYNGCFSINTRQYSDPAKGPLHAETSTGNNYSEMVLATSTRMAEYIKDVLMENDSVLYVCTMRNTDKYDKHFIVAVLPFAFSFIQVISTDEARVSVHQCKYNWSTIQTFAEGGMPQMHAMDGSWTIMQSTSSKQLARKKMRAFLMSTHHRLGKDSSASILEDADLIRYEIFNRTIKPDCECTEKEVVALLDSMCPLQASPLPSPIVKICMQCSGYILHGTG